MIITIIRRHAIGFRIELQAQLADIVTQTHRHAADLRGVA